MKETTHEWLSRAKEDIDVVEEIKNIKHLTNMVAFHAQQACAVWRKSRYRGPADLFDGEP